MKRLVILLITLICLLAMTSCEEDPSDTAIFPFYDEKDIAYDPALVGNWILYGDNQPEYEEPIELRFEEPPSSSSTAQTGNAQTASQPAPKPTLYKIKVRAPGAEDESDAVPFQVEGEPFLDIERHGTANHHAFLPGAPLTHMVLRIQLKGDVLIVARFNSTWVDKHVPEDRRRWTTILLPTDDLKKLLSQALKDRDAFSGEYRFSREDSDAARRDLVDYGERAMAFDLLSRGEYEQALTAFQQATNARPDSHNNYFGLASVQAADGDFTGARQSVRNWIQQCRDALDHGFGHGTCFLIDNSPPEKVRAVLNVAEHQLLGTSYFAERDWKNAEREFALAMASSEPRAKDDEDQDNSAIFLQTLVLEHLKRKDEALAILNRKREGMKSEADKAITDYIRGTLKEADLVKQVKGPNPPSSDENECDRECSAYFYIGSHYFAAGDTQTARKWFEKTLEMKQFVGFEPIIARVRLKQLQQK